MFIGSIGIGDGEIEKRRKDNIYIYKKVCQK